MGSGPCSPRFMDLGNDSYISSVLQCVRMPPQLRSSWCWNSPLRYLLGIAAIECEQRRLTSVRADSRSPNCGSPPYIHCETRPVRRITVGDPLGARTGLGSPSHAGPDGVVLSLALPVSENRFEDDSPDDSPPPPSSSLKPPTWRLPMDALRASAEQLYVHPARRVRVLLTPVSTA